jgi:hypothetical protein
LLIGSVSLGRTPGSHRRALVLLLRAAVEALELQGTAGAAQDDLGHFSPDPSSRRTHGRRRSLNIAGSPRRHSPMWTHWSRSNMTSMSLPR